MTPTPDEYEEEFGAELALVRDWCRGIVITHCLPCAYRGTADPDCPGCDGTGRRVYREETDVPR